jgi:hypothetical protein
MKSRIVLFVAIVFGLSVLTAISFAQRRPDAADRPITGDFKITIRNTVSGQTYQTTTMIKGKRERSETNMMAGGMNNGSVNITQCDMRRTIQVNDRSKMYLITPMDSESNDSGGGASGPSSSGPNTRGGLVTMTVNTVDTGERKEMFGFTARHLKRSMTSQTSPDACYQNQIRMETDGWYINLEYGLSCGSSDRPPQMGAASGGCRDRYQFKRTGPTQLGYPLMETMTMYGADGSAMFTRNQEVIELSRQPLDAAFFEIPAGYTQARTQGEMSGAPSMADAMAMSRQQTGDNHTGADQSAQPSTTGMQSSANAGARVRVGVVEFNNKTKSTVSTDSLREQLIAMLNSNGIDAVALNGSSPSEAAMEAKAKRCAYILFTDIAALKSASSGKKIGGFLGRAAGVDTGAAGKSEVRLDFRMMPAGSSSPTLQSSASSKEDNEQASVSAALENEAKAVASAAAKM